MKYIFQYKYTLGLLVLILYLCLTTMPHVSGLELFGWLGIDKWVHFGLYFMLCFAWSYENSNFRNSMTLFLIIGVWGSRTRKLKAAYQFFLYTLIGSLFMLLEKLQD